jgi:hypothetical protein
MLLDTINVSIIETSQMADIIFTGTGRLFAAYPAYIIVALGMVLVATAGVTLYLRSTRVSRPIRKLNHNPVQALGQIGPGLAAESESNSIKTSGLAIASLVLSLIGPVGSIPAVICGHLALRKMKKEPIAQGRWLALVGLTVGYTIPCIFTIMIILPLLSSLLWEARLPRAAKQRLQQRVVLKQFPINNLEGIITKSGVEFDRDVSSDAHGSLRITATGPTVVQLFEIDDIDIENATLIYQARVRTKAVEGKVYLEMWCHFPAKEEFFSQSLETPLTGSTDWTTKIISLFLEKGENPDNVKLNLVINGNGTVWIDDIRLLKGLPK